MESRARQHGNGMEIDFEMVDIECNLPAPDELTLRVEHADDPARSDDHPGGIGGDRAHLSLDLMAPADTPVLLHRSFLPAELVEMVAGLFADAVEPTPALSAHGQHTCPEHAVEQLRQPRSAHVKSPLQHLI